jgi:hypothetical protein
MKVLLFQVDGKRTPNLALMRLSAWHKAKGDEVVLLRSIQDLWFTEGIDRAYASSIFTASKARREEFAKRFPNAITGGDGYKPIWDLHIIGKDIGSKLSEVIKDTDPNTIIPDYSIYPYFQDSIGYSQRGCRLDCGFCRMKTREGDPRSVSTLREIWRGKPYPKHVYLLDNDFFGQNEWHARLDEAVNWSFKVCFNQGINIRLINETQARVLSRVFYCDDQFKVRRLYTAWDNLGDERVFKAGVELLKSAGIPPRHLMVYMLVGFRANETMEEIMYRFNELKALGCRPYPMVFNKYLEIDPERFYELKKFQAWVVRRYYEFVPWKEFGEWREPTSGIVQEDLAL